MRIDARLLVRYRGEQPTEAELTRWSWDLCSIIGAQHFFISDGLSQDEFEIAMRAYDNAWRSHPCYKHWVKSGNPALKNTIVADIGRSPTLRVLAIELTRPPHDDDEVPENNLRAPGLVYLQDGPSIFAQPGEWFLEVNPLTRYFGIGYESGDIITICAVAEWCEQNLQPCEVWYGGDSGGVLAKSFNVSERAKLLRQFYSTGRKYRDFFSHVPRGTFPTPKPCGLCVSGENRFDLYRRSTDEKWIGVSCKGCGKIFDSRDDGTCWTVVGKISNQQS